MVANNLPDIYTTGFLMYVISDQALTTDSTSRQLLAINYSSSGTFYCIGTADLSTPRACLDCYRLLELILIGFYDMYIQMSRKEAI